jgi:hypothetical protein
VDKTGKIMIVWQIVLMILMLAWFIGTVYGLMIIAVSIGAIK